MKNFTVLYYKEVCMQYDHIEAESEEEAIDQVMNNPERVPDDEYLVMGGDYRAEEQPFPSSLERKE